MTTTNYYLKITEKSETHLKCALNFPKDFVVFKGHFTDFPLLPGFYQALTALNLAKSHCRKNIKFVGLKSVKFRQPIFADTNLELKVFIDTKNSILSFEYLHSHDYYSKGQIKISHEF